MSDREKVIKESEEAIDILAKAEEPTFWMDFVRCAFENALELLKEREAVEPKAIRMNAFGHPVYACGKCGLLITESMNYCHECGKRIKWEGR